MPIRILPPILANQIAAGEVVERPSSVVKELVENSLDAGADRVEIDIEKGGAKLIRIRDNGCGVPQDELVLALSRHATSKVATLDDLEGIASLGFRGEALASISSVSRLTFTSKTAAQSEAWQAQAEGREMQVAVRPAAHPVGTTVEVNDLFFNTPARRKFLRSEKTEFAHIDELIRRIALSRFDITLILRHNGKVVRQYKAAQTVQEQERRLAAVCGTPFMHHALAVESEHSDVRLRGWISTPQGARAQNDLQYTYVNGRMMRDKLINHAIRQAYDELLPSDHHAAYVLYIELDPRQVDVNVHPAKHEVRFHQARLVHDFIFQALYTALRQAADAELPLAESQVELPSAPAPVYPGQAARGEWYEAEHAYRAPASVQESPGGFSAGAGVGRGPREGVDPRAVRGMQALMSTLPAAEPVALPEPASVTTGARALSLVQGRYLLWEQGGRLGLLSLRRAEGVLLLAHLQEQWPQGLTTQPLLLPVSLKLPASLLEQSELRGEVLRRMGFESKGGGRETLILTRVPALLRSCDLARLFPELLQILASLPEAIGESERDQLCRWLIEQGCGTGKVYDFTTASRLLQELACDYSDLLDGPSLTRLLPVAELIEEFERG
ncbi:DNA mismatch repair endonuclease MutL [Aeromonas schubertii]|uniref:DNA mismatch repair protein MutL n=1 Tax=Aeromonas schubertii TaxID=652 RepID=A0ABS7VFJ8_9GAMM|nr:DNA mismatch repair endonuclease MutL [Aeromonas schubertii]MBZ6068165.1 DNA mismatch repair endonuclease MutL [Aeromonas schubertii]